ncbi:hypothetical protein A1O7_05585 [Cladophialophora yegresii CBS 114405]|uniref:Extracellular mutant protein 11 C-terminal domain-containing protein n=1 Tax=Cladophialophora yegresii CBS 114405 TaxID=1182544 RepID=W9VZL5_9EURO|nr:uncharacterized protein A1O7_05585 [Cladophialophora yegresii CBS 114405]EXJ58160.1 hypothetical protein A1O7_05585 [Cladophialophora yegresii CBS 114405]
MPLNESTTMQQFVNSRTSAVQPTRPDKRPLTPQPNPSRERALQRQDDSRRKAQSASRNKESNEPLSREEAAKLKIDVPDMRPKSKLAQVTQSNAVQRPAAPPYTIFTERISGMDSRPSAFDDTQSIHYDDSMSVTDVQFPFSYGQGRNSPRLGSAGPPIPSFPTIQREMAAEDKQGIGQPGGWMDEVDAEMERHGMAPKYGTRFKHNLYAVRPAEDDYDDGSEHDCGMDEGTFLIENTPSRTRVVPDHSTAVKPRSEALTKPVKAEEAAGQPLPRHRKSLSDVNQMTTAQPLLRPQLARDRFHVHKSQESTAGIERSGTPQQQLHAPQPRPPQVQAPAFSSKVSSYHESSSEEDQPVPQPPVSESPRPGTKRPPPPARDLDFDPEELSNKTIAELDSIPFPTDPRLPNPSPVMDSNGQPLTLPAKLTNLTKMRPEDQATLFKSLGDTEREQTAEWFLEKIREDIVDLMDIRVQRRKVALKFEMEVKKREQQVRVKKGDVEEELAGLKKGGTELVRGKSPAK